MKPLVSVIVPAFNAEATIGATLRSALAQSRRDIEVIVVDDGSVDGTAGVVEELAAADARLRLQRQPRSGVAAARNRAIDLAQGAFIAPLDADDLWHPTKLERQLRRFETGGPDLGLVYSWYRLVDETGAVLRPGSQPTIEGRVLHRHLEWNFVQNGSAPLIRTAALAGLRYAPELQREGAPGCEDYLLQLQIAIRWGFACAPGFLIGYRWSPGAMSANRGRMLRSHIAMYRILEPSLPPSARALCRRMIADYQVRLSRNMAGAGRLAEAGKALGVAFGEDLPAALATAAKAYASLPRLALRRLRPELSGSGAGPSFFALDPMERLSSGPSASVTRRAERLGCRA